VNPVLVEQNFQVLLATLPLIMSRRTRLLKVCEFLEPLLAGADRKFLAAYIPQLIQIIQRDLPHCNGEGTSALFYARIQRLLEDVRNDSTAFLDGNEWDQLLGQCASLREKARAFSLRTTSVPFVVPHWRHRGKSIAPYVPVVETEPLVPALSGNFASVCPLVIDASRKPRGTREDSVFLELYADPDAAQKNTIGISSRAARALYAKAMGKPFAHALNIHCSFGQQGMIVGSSLGVAAAAALYCELVRLTEESAQVSFLPGIALTGSVDEHGNVLAVDPGALEKKLEACLYAPVRIVVVPKEQYLAAGAFFADRKSKETVHPPELVGISTIEEIFYDRRITHFYTLPLPLRMVRRAWRQRRPLAVATFAILLAVIVMLVIPRLDDNPVYGEYKDRWLVVKNRYGHELERDEVSTKIVSWARESYATHSRASQLHAFCDVDGDGTNELVYVRGDERGAESDRLVCRSVARGRILWQKKLTWPINFPAQPDANGDHMNILGFYMARVDSSTAKKLVVFANSIYFPSVIMKLDPRTGKEEEVYLHVGQLADMICVDLDGDGIDELVACGTNNAFGAAAVFALDGGAMDGCSPTRGRYLPKDYALAREREYVLIPRTTAGEVVRDLDPRNGALSIRCDTAVKHLSLNVEDFLLDLQELHSHLRAELVVEFDCNLRPVSIGTTNNYDLAVARMVRLGWMKQAPDADYFAQYLTTFPRWNGREFVPTPGAYR
jgi:hypothetical protein